MDRVMDRRRVMATGAAIAGGTLATRLARLEWAAPPAPDGGDALVIAFEHPDGSREVSGVIGAESHVVVIRARLDGPQ